MYTVEKIRIYEVEQFASQLVNKLPKVEAEPDGFDIFSKEVEFDIEVGDVVVFGKVIKSGSYRCVRSESYLSPAEYSDFEVVEVEDMTFWIDGEPVMVENEDEVLKKVNELV
jgi:hypothetical protein